MKTSQALTKYGYWRLFRFGEQDERFSSKADGLSRLEALQMQGVSCAWLSHPLTRDEYHLGSDGIKCVKNSYGFAAWLFEQFIAYTLLIFGVVVAFGLFALNPKWAWWFVLISGVASGFIGLCLLVSGLTWPGNKKFLFFGLVVYFLPALGAYIVVTNPTI